jgi:hypothetical protein
MTLLLPFSVTKYSAIFKEVKGFSLTKYSANFAKVKGYFGINKNQLESIVADCG